MADAKREIRRHLLVMVVLVLLIDAIAVAVFATLGIERAPRDRKMAFTAVWTIATLAVVLNGLYRIRVVRNDARRRGL